MEYKIILRKASRFYTQHMTKSLISTKQNVFKCSDICNDIHPWNITDISKGHAEGTKTTTGHSAQHIALQLTTNGHLKSLLRLF
jgi:hypothetical protein